MQNFNHYTANKLKGVFEECANFSNEVFIDEKLKTKPLNLNVGRDLSPEIV